MVDGSFVLFVEEGDFGKVIDGLFVEENVLLCLWYDVGKVLLVWWCV